MLWGCDLSDAVFGNLMTGHFRLFIGRNARFFADLLVFLDGTSLGLGADMPNRKQVLRSIGEFIRERNWQTKIDESELDGEGTEPAVQDITADGSLQSRVLSRLIACGWLVPSRDGRRRLVDFDSEARYLLGALIAIREGRIRSFGGEVLKVRTLLQTAIDSPMESGVNAISAGASSRNFMMALRTITSGLRAIERDMRGHRSARNMLNEFFRSYVSDTLIADFKALRTVNSPYRFRTEVVSQAEWLQGEAARLSEMADGLVIAGHSRDKRAASAELDQAISEIIQAFRSVNELLEIIERVFARIENRIVNTARFLAQMRDDKTFELTEAIAAISATQLPDDAIFRHEGIFLDLSLPIDAASLFRARARPRRFVATVARRPPRDEAQLAYERARRAYFERTLVTPRKILLYLERELNGRDQAEAGDLKITDLDDFFVFERLRAMPGMLDLGLRAFRFVRLEGRFVNSWIDCPAFRIERADAVAADGTRV